MFQSYLKYSRYHLVEKRAANSHSFTGVRHVDQAFIAWPLLATWIIVIETHSKEKIFFAYLFEVLGQEAKMIQITGDVKTNGAETIQIRVNLLVRNVLPCDDMLFS